MSTAPSQDPQLKKLHGLLRQCAKSYEDGGTKIADAYSSKMVDLEQKGAGTWGLHAYSSLHLQGAINVPRIATVLMVQGVVKKRRRDEKQAVRLGESALAQAIINRRGIGWFTITQQQDDEITRYMDMKNERASNYFVVKVNSPTPEPRASAHPSDPTRSRESSRELTPFGMLGTQGPFKAQLRGAKWQDLHPPPRVVAGNLVPARFLQQPGVAKNMNLKAGSLPITMLGEGCAREAKGAFEHQVQGLVALRAFVSAVDEVSDPAAIEKMTKMQLIQVINKQRDGIRKVDNCIDTIMKNARQLYPDRFGQWQDLFVQISNDQAQNPRPGLYTPAKYNERNELLDLEAEVQQAVNPDSVPRPAQPVQTPSSSHFHAQLAPLPGNSSQGSFSGSLSQTEMMPHRPQPLPDFGSRPPIIGHSSHPQLPPSSSQGSYGGWGMSQPMGYPSFNAPGYSYNTGFREQVTPVPSSGRGASQEPVWFPPSTGQSDHVVRNLFGPSSSSRRNAQVEDDQDDDDVPSWSQGDPAISRTARRKRESQSGASAHGRNRKSPNKQDVPRDQHYAW